MPQCRCDTDSHRRVQQGTTAATGEGSSGHRDSASVPKMLPMCSATGAGAHQPRRDRGSERPSPSARGPRLASGELVDRVVARTGPAASWPTTAGRAPSRPRRRGGRSRTALQIGDALLEQVADALGAGGQQLDRVARVDVLGGTRMPTAGHRDGLLPRAVLRRSSEACGCRRPRRRAARAPPARAARLRRRQPHDLEPGLLEQPGEALAEDHGVVGERYPHGTSARSEVPRQGGLDTVSCPRRLDPVRQPPQARAARRSGTADPSSETSTSSVPPAQRAVTWTSLAWECWRRWSVPRWRRDRRRS